jgi:hypothetical protein
MVQRTEITVEKSDEVKVKGAAHRNIFYTAIEY